MPLPSDEDRCPYDRPFPMGFNGCPAYQPRALVISDSMARPMGVVNSCQFMAAAPGASRGHFYPQCSVGTQQDRLAWVERVNPERAAVVREMREELDRALSATLTEAYLAKSRSIEEPANPLLQAQMAELAMALSHSLDDFLTANAERLERVGISLEPLRRFIQQTIEAWRLSRTTDGAAHDPTLLDSFPPGVRELLSGKPVRPAKPQSPATNP